MEGAVLYYCFMGLGKFHAKHVIAFINWTSVKMNLKTISLLYEEGPEGRGCLLILAFFPQIRIIYPHSPRVKQAPKSFPSRYIVPPKGFKPEFTFSDVIKSVDDK